MLPLGYFDQHEKQTQPFLSEEKIERLILRYENYILFESRKARPPFFRVLYKMTLKVNGTNLNCGNTTQTTINKRLKRYFQNYKRR